MKETCKGTKVDGGSCRQVNFAKNGYCYRHQAQAPDDGAPTSPEPVDEPVSAPVMGKKIDLTAPVKIGDPDERAKIAAERRLRTRAEKKRMGGLPGQTMLAKKRPGYLRRWINDTADRIDEMLDRGYDFVLDRDASLNSEDLGTRKSHQVSRYGPPVTAYLMEIPEKSYREHQLEKEQVVQDTEDSLRSASDGIGRSRDSAGQSVVYNPSKSGNHLLD